MQTNTQEVAEAISHKWFATMPSIEEAAAYVYELAKASDNPSAVMTAVQVYANTVAAVLSGEATIAKAVKATIGQAEQI